MDRIIPSLTRARDPAGSALARALITKLITPIVTWAEFRLLVKCRSVSPNDVSQMGSIKVWLARWRVSRPRLAVEDVLISLPHPGVRRKEGGKKWGEEHLEPIFTSRDSENWVWVSGEMSGLVFSTPFLNQRRSCQDNKRPALAATDGWSPSSLVLTCWLLLSPVLYQFREFEQMKRILCPPDKKGMLQRVNHRTGAEWSIITINHLLIRNWQLMACLN